MLYKFHTYIHVMTMKGSSPLDVGHGNGLEGIVTASVYPGRFNVYAGNTEPGLSR